MTQLLPQLLLIGLAINVLVVVLVWHLYSNLTRLGQRLEKIEELNGRLDKVETRLEHLERELETKLSSPEASVLSKRLRRMEEMLEKLARSDDEQAQGRRAVQKNIFDLREQMGHDYALPLKRLERFAERTEFAVAEIQAMTTRRASPESKDAPTLKKTVLIVDDNPSDRELEAMAMEDAGYAVRTAGSAEETIAILATTDFIPSVILMDLRMPKIDGLELTRMLKAETHTKAIPVIALTASGDPENGTRALAVGCKGCVSKPINAHLLVGVLEKILG